MDYREFLKTPLWRETAARIRRKHNNCCQRCDAGDRRLIIHHDGYRLRNRFDAPDWVEAGWLPDDSFLECLCEECHEFLHGRGPDPMYIPSIAELMEMIRKL